MGWKRKRPSLAIALLAMLLVLAACGSKAPASGPQGAGGLSQNAGTPAAANKGKAAPPFELVDVKGNEVSLAGFAGQKVYVKYWASWCPICLAGMDELNTLAGEDNDFKIVTIVSPNFKGEMSEADFKEWFQGLQADGTAANLTVLLDDDGEWAQKSGIRGYPTSLYIGSDGVLVKSAPGHNTNEIIAETFAQIF